MVGEGFSDDLLPKALPAVGLVPASVVEELMQREHLSDFEVRSTHWSYAALKAFFGASWWEAFRPVNQIWGANIHRRVRWQAQLFEMVAAGLLPPLADKSSSAKDKERLFGITLHVAPWLDHPEMIGEVHLPDATGLTVKIPVYIASGLQELHGLPQPSNGQSTCWAQDAHARAGVVTAKHVVHHASVGSVLGFSGAQATLTAIAQGPIDAAFLTCSPPGGLPATLPTVQYPAMGTQVNLHRANSVITPTSIASVTWTHGVFNNWNMPIWVTLTGTGSPGDSGALLTDSANGDGIGLYTGTLQVNCTGGPASPGSSGTLGLCQHLHQVEAILGLSMHL